MPKKILRTLTLTDTDMHTYKINLESNAGYIIVTQRKLVIYISRMAVEVKPSRQQA